MFPTNFYTFKIKLKDKSYCTSENIIYKQTAAIAFITNTIRKYPVELGYISNEEVYNKINQKEPLF
jgi:hypothetical protein